jgi:leucyl-tRNA synthetase
MYDPQSIEKKWQDKWYSSDVFKADDSSDKPKKYILDMFPYPSAAGLHVGHPESYTATDILSRYYRMNGYNVLHPMGWDAFGLPAENHAIKTGVHPKANTAENIENFRRQIKSLGFSYDWDREINTSSPEYYRWTQWWFQFLYKNGLAYKKAAKVNWCDKCQTVIANEQVVNGNCERCDSPVIQKNLEQWFFRITEFSQDLIDGLDKIDWPESTKTQQLNWIGRSEGAEVIFKIEGGHSELVSESLSQSYDLIVYTTRPDTLFGATYVVMAPDHGLLEKLSTQISNFDEVKKYQEATKRKSDLQRTDLNKDKSGVSLEGVFAINPVNQEKLPVFIADYVLSTYGTGAIMAVPAHDQRDWDFAKKYDLPMIEVLQSPNGIAEAAWEDDGEHINSEFLNGLNKEAAVRKINEFLESKNLGKAKINFRLRDWLVSRQRYWGAPIPVIYCEKCGEQLVPEKDLPVILPDDVDFRPTGESPLTRSESFHKVTCPKCGGAARRESDTMDTFVCSSWYYLRFIDPHNDQNLASADLLKKWLPVDVYLGGAEHTVLHLLYARFFMKALQKYGGLDLDQKYVEPFYKLRHQGMILGEDGNKMSKSKGNVINPDEVVNEYGADTLRLYEMFMGALEDMKPWNTKNILGVRRFLEKVWNLQEKVQSGDFPEVEKVLHRTIKKVGDDILAFGFNTAISQMMIFANTAKDGLNQNQFERFLKILSPFAPHLSEELWALLSHETFVAREAWPSFDEAFLQDDTVSVGIQINGKLRDTIEFDKNLSEAEVKELVLAREKVQKWLEGQELKKFIYVSGKIINIVIG